MFLVGEIWRNRNRCQNFWKTWRNSSGAGRCILNNKSIGRFFAADFYLSLEYGKPVYISSARLHQLNILFSICRAAYLSGWWMKSRKILEWSSPAEMELSPLYGNVQTPVDLYSISLLSHSNLSTIFKTPLTRGFVTTWERFLIEDDDKYRNKPASQRDVQAQ